MNKGIVITTSEHTKDWLKDCLDSIKTDYPILVVSNGGVSACPHGVLNIVNDWNGFELGGILRGKQYFDSFVHLMDTTIIKNNDLFDELFDLPGNVMLTDGGYHYMGKFESRYLPDIPMISTKADAIALELQWLRGNFDCFKPDLPVHTNVFEDKHGRKNMVLENDYLIKYKATWSL